MQPDPDTAISPAPAPPRKRRARDPDATRHAILAAARQLLAQDGPEGISLAEVARVAGVNRGTAYQHFRTRDALVRATIEWVSEQLHDVVFGGVAGELDSVDIAAISDRLAAFAVDNPELCRVWLMQVLTSPDPVDDPFWRAYQRNFARFAVTDRAEPGIDVEVLTVIMLAGTLLWPIWSRSHDTGDAGRATLARRFSDECLRLTMFGTLRTERHPDLARRLRTDGKS